jgi:hypothetical protein
MACFGRSPEEIQGAINDRFTELFTRTSDAESWSPHVCICCDELIKPQNVSWLTPKWLKQNEGVLIEQEFAKFNNDYLRNEYKYPQEKKGYQSFMENMVLSPRATYRAYRKGFSCCSSCLTPLMKRCLPTDSIANNNFTGKCPSVLDELTHVELAYLCPVRTHGYCFTFQGGKSMNLKGTLGYFKVDPNQITQGLSFLKSLGANVVVLINGKMTSSQKVKARQYAKIRIDKLYNAVLWLVENNVLWKDVDPSKWKEYFENRNPVLLDDSEEVDGSSDEKESKDEVTERFCVFYPDGKIHSVTGGQSTAEEFHAMVTSAKNRGFDVEFLPDLDREFIKDEAKTHSLMLSSLVQFPYGRGGLNEMRLTKDEGICDDDVDPTYFSEKLARRSLPQFHQPLFCLILYNIGLKKTMLNSASMVIDNGEEAEQIANGLSMSDVSRSAASFATGASMGSNVSHAYLQKIKAVAGSLPHTNESAGKARLKMEAMHHNLGPPHVFLTVTPDDDNNILLQIYSGSHIDDDVDPTELTDEELRRRNEARTQLRLKYPGLSSVMFEDLLEIIMEEVIGWDMKNNKPTENDGLCGNCTACTLSVEEQGRKSLHVHIMAWYAKMKQIYKRLKSRNVIERREARTIIAKNYDNVVSTEMFGAMTNTKKRKLLQVFDHECSVEIGSRDLPEVVDRQELRNLRHKHGHMSRNGLFMYCPHCTSGCRYTNEEAIEQYLKKGIEVGGLTSYPDKGTGRLEAMIVAHQNPNLEMELDPIINYAAYNNHLSTHTKTCFRCNKKDRKARMFSSDYECRMAYPQLPNLQRTHIEETQEFRHFSWNGTEVVLPFYVLKPRRGRYDLFQNKACKAITESKISGNSNISFLFPGPVTVYTSKYYCKGNQKDEQRDFARVVRETQKMLAQGRRHEGNRAEVMRMVLRATYQHTTENVIGAPMASYLVRNKSRFYFSGEFAFCHLKEMIDILHGRSVRAQVKRYGTMVIVEKPCLDYLCRGEEMENMCYFDMVKEYKTAFIKKNDDAVLPFENTMYFDHPSNIRNIIRQGLKLRDKKVLVQIPQRLFCDTGNFKGNLLHTATEITAAMERYSLLVLALFYPYRCLEDLNDGGNVKFTQKLRQVYNARALMPGFEYLLNNIQDSAHNYLRYELPDELKETTHTYKPEDAAFMKDVRIDEENNEELSKLILGDNLFEEMGEDEDLQDGTEEIDHISFKRICRRGKEDVLDESVISDSVFLDDAEHGGSIPQFLKVDVPEPTTVPEEDAMEVDTNEESIPGNAEWHNPSRARIHKLFLSRTLSPKKVPTCDEEINLMVANGTAESVVDWMSKTNLDTPQQKAFSTILCQFLLTFYTDEDEEEDSEGMSRQAKFEYRREKRRLQNMVKLGNRSGTYDDQLIMLLHGSGGSGKSTVIELVQEYAKCYCDYLDYPYTSNTIVVTAISGVAATLLGGNTTTKKCCLSRKPTTQDIYEWKHTRLLFIDEISFASGHEVKELNGKLKVLCNRIKEHRKFGGIHIVFAGDFRQLEPVQKESLFKKRCDEFEWVNCFVELDGMHRFKTDKTWGLLLRRFRDGMATVEDINLINKKCLIGEDTKVPDGIQYASFKNRTRDVINTEVFLKYCDKNRNSDDLVDGAVMIFADGLMRKTGEKVWERIGCRKFFYESLGEDDIKPGQMKPRLDPVLKLFRDCPMMLTHNEAVELGMANGTCCTLEQVVLRAGESTFIVTLDNGAKVKGVYASQVDRLILRHANKNMEEKLFAIKSKVFTVQADWPLPKSLRTSNKRSEKIPMKMHQFPIVRNSATTGHKLQGKTVDSIFVYDWNYVSNWAYVVLSRVTTMNGVLMRKPLSTDTSLYMIPEELPILLNFLSRMEPNYPSMQEYMQTARATHNSGLILC